MIATELAEPVLPTAQVIDPVPSSDSAESAANALTYTTIPELGPRVPRRGNRLTRGFFGGVMRLMGWRLEGQFPDVPKVVLLGAPHTANQDFFMAMLTALTLGVDMTFVMKHTPFKGPVGRLLRWLGGIGLDRDKSRNFVAQMVDAFNSREKIAMAIMPEGTRSVTEGWKSGFYYIAAGASVPIVLITFDYAHKTMRTGPAFVPTGDYAADLPRIQSHLVGIMGKYPDRTLPLPTVPQ